MVQDAGGSPIGRVSFAGNGLLFFAGRCLEGSKDKKVSSFHKTGISNISRILLSGVEELGRDCSQSMTLDEVFSTVDLAEGLFLLGFGFSLGTAALAGTSGTLKSSGFSAFERSGLESDVAGLLETELGDVVSQFVTLVTSTVVPSNEPLLRCSKNSASNCSVLLTFS